MKWLRPGISGAGAIGIGASGGGSPSVGYGTAYDQKVLGYGPCAYWPFDEAAGIVAFDQSGNGFDGAITGCTLGQAGIGDGATSFLFDGVNDFVNVFSVAIAAAYNGDEGSMMCWVKPFNIGVWNDGSNRVMTRFVNAGMAPPADRTQIVTLGGGAGSLLYNRVAAGNVDQVNQPTAGWGAVWYLITMTWSISAGVNGELKAYRDNVQQGATQVNLAAFPTTITEAFIGATSVVPTGVWHGWMAKPALWCGTVLQQADITDLATI